MPCFFILFPGHQTESVGLKFLGFFFPPILGRLSISIIRGPIHHSIVCDAAPTKKADSAAKRARQAEKRRIYNKARKSEVRTRMKKVIYFSKIVFEIDGLAWFSFACSGLFDGNVSVHLDCIVFVGSYCGRVFVLVGF